MSCYFWTSQRSGLWVKLYKPAEWFVGCYFVQASGVVCELLFLYKPAEWFVSCYFLYKPAGWFVGCYLVQTSRVVCELLLYASQWSGL